MGASLMVWSRTVQTLAALKIAGAIVAFITIDPTNTRAGPIPPFVHLTHIFVFSAVALLLFLGSRGDRRASNLGTVFLLAAAAFAQGQLRNTAPSWAGLKHLTAVQPEAFLPWFLWLFVSEFPRHLKTSLVSTICRAGISLSLLSGVFLFGVNALVFFEEYAAFAKPLVPFLAPRSLMFPSYFWTILSILMVPGIGLVLRKATGSGVTEQRRVLLFVTGIAVGATPMLGDIILERLIPAFGEFMSRAPVRRTAGLFVYTFLLSVPFTTSYSVLVHHVLDVRLIVRRAIQYAMARYSVLAVTSFPLVLLGGLLYQQREISLHHLFSGRRSPTLLAAATLGLVMYRFRRPALDFIDRKFFREQYDARTILASLAERSHGRSDPGQLGALLAEEIERALHLTSIEVFILEGQTFQLRSVMGTLRPLSLTSPLAAFLAASAEPLEIDRKPAASFLRRLPTQDLEWLADCNIYLLVPLIASDGRLIGIIAMGEKKSELPFSGEDRLLLRAIAASATLALENRIVEASSGCVGTSTAMAVPPKEEPAMKCVQCYRILPSSAGQCDQCTGTTVPVSLPYILLGKFRLERQVGAGGMGIVFRATDLALGRAVALKTLPRVSLEESMWLRREARTMAAVTHPNLALIYGAESWRGMPILIVEFLEQGSLADRLKSGPLAIDEVIDLGIALCGALDCIHAHGILHRDIKPSNLGFTHQSVPKLLDFGLAKLIEDPRRDRSSGATSSSSQTDTTSKAMTLLENPATAGRLAGTLAYLSPEAVNYADPSPYFDLWSLAITLLETMAGKNPMARPTRFETLECISKAAVPDIRTLFPKPPESLVHLFNGLLARDARKRPATAAEFEKRLRAFRLSLPNTPSS